MEPQDRTADRTLARRASRQHGVLTWREMRDAGLSEGEIEWRVQRGTLIRVHDGVYRVGHAAPSIEASLIAAVKACGEGSLLRGRSGAFFWGLIRQPPREPEVLTPTERKVEGVRTKRARGGIDRRDMGKWRGIPVTTVPRTVVDVAPLYSDEELARIFHEAVVRHGTKPEHLEAVLRRRPNSRGAKRLRAAMYGDGAVRLSKLEDAFHELLEAARLPLPKTNERVGSHLIDCRWLAHKLTVELDSYAYHSTRHAWERDRDREREARRRGDRFERFTWEDVIERPAETVAVLRQLLSTPPS